MAARKQILRLLAGSQKSLAARNVALVQKRGLLLSPSAQEAAIANAFFKPKLVIFDKDGTLVCFHTMWTPWCHAMADRMTHATGEPDVVDNLFEVLGYDHKERKVRLGALAENTHPQIRDLIHDMLVFSHGMSPVKAKDVVNETWQDTPEDMKIKTTGNLQKLFERLKAQDIKIAICTSDSREGTMEFVKREKLSHLIDAVVCGDDSFSRPKPNPHNAMYLCDKLGISPTDTIMVGDTPADTLMGQQANLGLTVGVLTGVGNMHDLADADVIVADVQECVEMILPCPEKSRQRVHQVTTRGLSKIAQGSWLFHGRKGNLPQGSRAYSTRVPGFSHIVIGAGSAGCVMTNRLTEDSQNSVLLLEAGPEDTILNSKFLQWKIHMPAALMYNLCDDKYNWYYHTVPQPFCNNRTMYWPRGRVWGGSSSLNAMVYIRGHPLDYDRWAYKEGAEGWEYQNVLPYFKKAQCHELGANDYRGGEGPLHVSRGTSGNVLHKVFIEAGQQAGHAVTEDVNGYMNEGVGFFDMTIHKGMRWSAASAYLHPALKRSNLKTEVNVLVTRILFDGKKAVGVEYVQNGETKTAMADQEIVLCGGAINSPQTLMLSGIGDADHLKELDIPVVAHVPGVGQNLQDHLEMYIVQKCKKPLTLYQYQSGVQMIKTGVEWFLRQTGAAATAHLESGGFVRSRTGVEHPDIMWHFLPSQVIDHGRTAPFLEAYQLHVGPMRATSKGFIKLKSKDPKAHPIIDPKYLSTEIDRWEMRESIRLSREVFAQPAFDPFRDEELLPGSDVTTDEQLDEFVRQYADSAYHPSCTNKMGATTDPMTVVDPDTKVVGVDNLRVVDASIMPSVVSGNLNGPTIMMAERAADIIRGRTMLPPANVEIHKPDIQKKRESQR